MTTDALRISKWVIGLAVFVAVSLGFPLVGYGRKDSALLGLAFAIPPAMVFYLGEKGYFRKSGTWQRKVLLYGGAAGLVMSPPLILGLVLIGNTLLALGVCVGMLFDVWYVVRGARMGRETQPASQ